MYCPSPIRSEESQGIHRVKASGSAAKVMLFAELMLKVSKELSRLLEYE